MTGTLIGTTLGPYRIEAVLGSGGMGDVYAAVVEGGQGVAGLAAGTRVALKVLHPHLLESPGFFKRFLREAEVGRAVVHPNVVRTLDCDAVALGGAQHHFLVMEYVEGQTLRALLDELGRVPEELCRHIGREVAKGLAAIHAAGIVHRDVKPDNVIITKDHAVKVMDLGVARLADEALRLSQSGVFVGSVEYAAPEQFGLRRAEGAEEAIPRSRERPARSAKGDIDHRADLHALGVVLYELSTGLQPFSGDDFRAVMRRILDERPRRPAELNPQLSPFFEEALLTLTAKDRDERFASATEVVRVLSEGEESAWWQARATSIRVETRRPLRRIRVPRETALYGRDAEMARLRSLFERASGGDGQVALVEGEAGIGKSRLVDELAGLLQREGEDLNFLWGSYPPGGAATASGAFSTAYREQFGDANLGETLKEYLRPTPALVPAFAALLRGETTPAGVEPLTKDSLQTVFVHATRALAAERPTIVLIDDLHFAPEEGRALFAALAMAVPAHRVLLVGTARPGVDPRWLATFDRIGAARIALPRLGPKDLVRLLADSLKSQHLAEELAGRIAVKSDGNPFFVFEILRGLREGQFLTQRGDGTWATTRVIADIRIPSSVLELVQARVADLDQDQRNALDVASCLGFEFDPSVVAAVLGVATIPLLQRLAHVEKAHRLVRSAGRRFVFDHHQVQEALYDGLPEMLREEYHAAIGSEIESRSGAASKAPEAQDGAVCAELARHFLIGGRGDRAARWVRPALNHLADGYLNDAAIRLAERALAAPGCVTDRDRCTVLLHRSDSLEAVGRRADQEADVDAALSISDRLGDPVLRAKARITRGRFLHFAGRYDAAESVLREAWSIATGAGARREEAAALGVLANSLHRLGRDDEARELHERHRDLSAQMGNRRGEAYANSNLGLLLQGRCQYAEAKVLYERALAICREIHDRRGEGIATGNVGRVHEALGQYEEARACAERFVAMSGEIGNRRSQATAAGQLGNVLYEMGDYGAAREHHETSVALFRELGDLNGEAVSSGRLGVDLEVAGRYEEARRLHEESLEIHRRIGYRSGEAEATASLGRVARKEGRLEDAERLHRRHVEMCRENEDPRGEAIGLADLGTTLAAAGRTDEAAARFREALAPARRVPVPAVDLIASARLALLPSPDAAATLREALHVLAEREPAGCAGSALEARFLLWRATGDRTHLAEAKRRLDLAVARAREEDRVPMLANVRLHRDVAEAARAQGL